MLHYWGKQTELGPRAGCWLHAKKSTVFLRVGYAYMNHGTDRSIK